MKTYNSLNSYDKSPSVVTIGTFDGVHLGHQKIINRLVNAGKENNLRSIILTFFPHPRMVLQPESNIKLLHTIQERQDILAISDLDVLIIEPFTKEFANLTAEDYVKNVLVEQLNAKHIIIGYDHHFGKNRSANINDLKRFGKQFGFTVEEISVQDIEDVAISSTKIRNALFNGDVQTANRYLGHLFSIRGTIIKGRGLGKQLQFPTANIDIQESYKLIPKNGVYVVKCTLESKLFFGMMNIGTNPTVNGTKQSVEVHLFDFKDDIYDKIIKIELIERLRDEQKFESLELLTTQLQLDENNAKNILQRLND